MSHLTVAGKPLRGDFILELKLRTDLAPIPATLEAMVRYDADVAPLLVEGALVNSGQDNAAYRVIKVEPLFAKEGEQAGRPTAAIRFSAYLDKVATIGFRRRTAVIKENASLAQVYSACGARVAVETDIQVARFSCFIGDTPSYGIAAVLQEEGGVVHWTGKALKFQRLADLLAQKAAVKVDAEAVQKVTSGFLERHEIPFFYSTNDAGAVIAGNREKERAALYTPVKNERQLRNMTRCLVMRCTLKSIYRPDIYAGTVIEVDGVPHAVITACHVLNRGGDGSPQTTFSQFWLGTVEG